MMLMEKFEVQTLIQILAELGGLLKWPSIIAGFLSSFMFRKFIRKLATDFGEQMSKKTLEKLLDDEPTIIPELTVKAGEIKRLSYKQKLVRLVRARLNFINFLNIFFEIIIYIFFECFTFYFIFI